METKHSVGRDFVLGGNATFTMVGTNARFTYKVTRKDPEPGDRKQTPVYFVGLLSGSDNESDYRYLGVLDPVTGYTRLTRNSKFTLDAPSVKAIQWALPKVWANVVMPPSFALYHEGKCGKCGRKLTVPESIVTGFGPECSLAMGLTRPAGLSPVKTDNRQRGDGHWTRKRLAAGLPAGNLNKPRPGEARVSLTDLVAQYGNVAVNELPQ